MTCPMHKYLEQQLETHFNLFKLWHCNSSIAEFLKTHQRNTIRAVVGDTNIGADAELIASLPNLEIVASYSVGLDKIDLRKCEEKGIRVANTPDVLTDDVADLAIGLILGVLRTICASDVMLGLARGRMLILDWQQRSIKLSLPSFFSFISILILILCNVDCLNWSFRCNIWILGLITDERKVQACEI